MAELGAGFGYVTHSPKQKGESDGQVVDSWGQKGTSMIFFLNKCSFRGTTEIEALR